MFVFCSILQGSMWNKSLSFSRENGRICLGSDSGHINLRQITETPECSLCKLRHKVRLHNFYESFKAVRIFATCFERIRFIGSSGFVIFWVYNSFDLVLLVAYQFYQGTSNCFAFSDLFKNLKLSIISETVNFHD